MHDSRRAISKLRELRSGGGLASSAVSVLTKALKKIPIGTVVNTAIDALPVELHLPGGYQYCGPGTKLSKRLARGDPGINELDKACRVHDIAYSKYSDTANRSIADRALARKAWERVKSADAGIGERAAALAVAAAMKTKTAVGGGRRRRRVKRSVPNKRGGNIKQRTRRHKKKSKRSTTLWSMARTGRGLYLRPYRNVQ